MIKIKRIYAKPEKKDGYRILVDRLWPRGMAKEKAAIDLWLKEIAPSDSLRKWYAHDLTKWDEFKKKYYKELKTNQAAWLELKQIMQQEKNITLLYGHKDEKHNQAVLLKQFIADETDAT